MQNKKKKLVVLFSILILSSFLLYSCYPDYGLSVTDYDTVITLYDSTQNFNKPTYVMPDTVLHLIGDDQQDNIDRSNDALILSTVASNMLARGYQRVPLDTTADAPAFVMLVGVTTSQYQGITYWPGWGYWGGWGWWGGYPGWGYPGGGVSYWNFTTGTIAMSLLNPEKINPDNLTYAGVWLARVNGVLSSSVSTSQRIKSRIDDAFNQSPYLGYSGSN